MTWVITFLVLSVWTYFCRNSKSKRRADQFTFEDVVEIDVPKPIFPVNREDHLSQLVTADFKTSGPVIFMDIDGVFHRYQNESFERLSEIKALCQAVPELQIVLSSSWRHDADEQYIKSKMKDLYTRVVGATPILSPQSFRRQKEVLTFCKYYQVKTFLVVDDTSTHFEPDWDKLYLTDKSTGFLKSDTEVVSQYFHKKT